MNSKIILALDNCIPCMSYEMKNENCLIIKQEAYNTEYVSFVCPFCRTDYKTNGNPLKYSYNKCHVVHNPNYKNKKKKTLTIQSNLCDKHIKENYLFDNQTNYEFLLFLKEPVLKF